MAALALVLKIMIPTRLTMGPNRTQDKFRCSDGTGQGTEGPAILSRASRSRQVGKPDDSPNTRRAILVVLVSIHTVEGPYPKHRTADAM